MTPPRKPQRGRRGRTTAQPRRVESTLLNSRGGSRRWAKIAKEVAAKQPICWLQFPGICTYRSQTADHYYPRSTHPHLEEVRSNLRGACNACNHYRRDVQPSGIPALQRKCAEKFAHRQSPPKALGFFG